MKVRTTALGALAAVLVAAAAHAAPYADLKGRAYADARATLIKRGIRPVRVKWDRSVHGGSAGIWEVYPEALDCAGGVAPCAFAFRDESSGALIVVLANGEIVPVVTGFRSPPLPDERARMLKGTPAPANPFQDLNGRPYTEARKALISRGLSPVRAPHEATPWVCKDVSCEAHPEVLDCQALATRCAFAFRDRRTGEVWVVITRGEKPTVATVRPAYEDERAEILPD